MLGVTFGYLLVLVVDIDNRIKAVHAAYGPSHTLLYACETWTMYHRYIKCLESFQQTKPQRILRLTWQWSVIKNDVLSWTSFHGNITSILQVTCQECNPLDLYCPVWRAQWQGANRRHEMTLQGSVEKTKLTQSRGKPLLRIGLSGLGPSEVGNFRVQPSIWRGS